MYPSKKTNIKVVGSRKILGHNARPSLFRRSYDFEPERYLKDGKIDLKVLHLEVNVVASRFGRSIQSLTTMVASVLSCFRIKPPKDEKGQDIIMGPMDVSFEIIPVQSHLTVVPMSLWYLPSPAIDLATKDRKGLVNDSSQFASPPTSKILTAILLVEPSIDPFKGFQLNSLLSAEICW
ncbi:hypothetical protein BKA70DRAFT_743587 [Coprinopsis sp. MPI-PUGE-AT-0042]|nr:hypothetical protein BKA70DRAFT_743587 [Coprinopsis sp. MPI-PUGE-AT-0042]